MDENYRTARTRPNPLWERKAKWALLGAFALTVCYKLWLTPTYFSFGFAEALSLAISVFAVWLSLQFYFRTGELNAQANDRIYLFMKDAALVLGRIDAALGRRPEFSGAEPYRPGAFAADILAARQEELERARVEQATVTADKDKIILDLLNRANLRGNEAQKYFNLLAGKEQLLHELTRRQSLLEQQIFDAVLTPDDSRGLVAGGLKSVGKKIG